MRHLAFLALAVCGAMLFPPITVAKPVDAQPTTPPMGKLNTVTKTTAAKSWGAIPSTGRARVLKRREDLWQNRRYPREWEWIRSAPLSSFSVHLARYPLGANGTPLLVHVWADPNGSPHREGRQYHVDLFGTGTKGGAWRLLSTATFRGQNVPDAIEVRRLQPKARKGAVIWMEASNIRDSSVHFETVTFGTAAAASRGVAQTFRGDYRNTVYALGTDARGYTAVVATDRQKDEAASPSAKQQIFTWNGRGYVKHTTSR